MNKLLLILISVFLTTNVYAEEKLPIHKNQLLSKAKADLIRSGWKPYPTNKPEDIGLIQERYIEKGYIEVENCGASTPYCVFRYKQRRKCLNLVAGSYEENVEETIVVKWYLDCK